MKTLLFASLLLFAQFALADDLEISGNQALWAIPATATSCQNVKKGIAEADVSASHIRLGNLGFTWFDKVNSFTISSIQVKLVDPILNGGEYTCTVGGEALEALGETASWVAIPAAKNAATVRETDCSLVCGGISFAEETPATMNGKVEIYGYKTNANGEQTPAVFALPITVDNL